MIITVEGINNLGKIVSYWKGNSFFGFIKELIQLYKYGCKKFKITFIGP